ncbi:hypothetical protein LINGRAHAP2_LOCUS9342 [Linum grandiflorum]
MRTVLSFSYWPNQNPNLIRFGDPSLSPSPFFTAVRTSSISHRFSSALLLLLSIPATAATTTGRRLPLSLSLATTTRGGEDLSLPLSVVTTAAAAVASLLHHPHRFSSSLLFRSPATLNTISSFCLLLIPFDYQSSGPILRRRSSVFDLCCKRGTQLKEVSLWDEESRRMKMMMS